jgi:hypothetical protein
MLVIGVDESGQRGWRLLHWIPMGIPVTAYLVKSGVNRVQCGADPIVVDHEAFPVVALHSLPNDSVYHSAVKS